MATTPAKLTSIMDFLFHKGPIIFQKRRKNYLCIDFATKLHKKIYIKNEKVINRSIIKSAEIHKND